MTVEESKQDKRFIAGDNITLRNVKVRWAHLQTPDTMYKPMFSVECILEPADAAVLTELGMNVKDSEDGPFIKAKTYVTTQAGKKNRPPRIVGKNPKEPFTDEVGNNSVCNVIIWAKYRKVKGEIHLPAYLDAVQVIEHVEYTGNSGFDDVSAGGSSEEVPF